MLWGLADSDFYFAIGSGHPVFCWWWVLELECLAGRMIASWLLCYEYRCLSSSLFLLALFLECCLSAGRCFAWFRWNRFRCFWNLKRHFCWIPFEPFVMNSNFQRWLIWKLQGFRNETQWLFNYLTVWTGPLLQKHWTERPEALSSLPYVSMKFPLAPIGCFYPVINHHKTFDLLSFCKRCS